MNQNKNFKLRKWILVIMLISIFNGVLYAEEKPKTSVWMRQVNNCNESYIFSAFSNTFSIISDTGKKVLGTYVEEYIKNSDRFKLSLIVSADNGLSDCFNDAYDVSGKTFILYSFVNVKSNMLQLSETKTGYFFGSFLQTEKLSKEADSIVFRIIYNQLMAEIKAKNERLRRALNQKRTNDNIGLTSAQSTLNHEVNMEIINNMATSDHYNSSTGEYEGNW